MQKGGQSRGLGGLRRLWLGSFLYRGNTLPLGAKMGEPGKLQRSGKRLHTERAGRQSDRQHSGAPDRINDTANLGHIGAFLQPTQVETDSGALEEARRGCDTSGELIENGPRIGRTNTHLDQAHLAETNVDS